MFKTEKKQIVAIVLVAVATCIIGLSALIMAGVSVQTKQATVLGLLEIGRASCRERV